jgi:hypothetical protein
MTQNSEHHYQKATVIGGLRLLRTLDEVPAAA